MGHHNSKPCRRHHRMLSGSQSGSTERPPPYTETPEEPWCTADQSSSKHPERGIEIERDEEIVELRQRLTVRGKAVETLWKENNKLQADLANAKAGESCTMSSYDNFMDYRSLANEQRQKIHQLHQQGRMERDARDQTIAALEKKVEDLEEYIGKKESDLVYYQSQCTKAWEEVKTADAEVVQMSHRLMRFEVEAQANKRILESRDDHIDLLERKLRVVRYTNAQHGALGRPTLERSPRAGQYVATSIEQFELPALVDGLLESIVETKKKGQELDKAEDARNCQVTDHGEDPEIVVETGRQPVPTKQITN